MASVIIIVVVVVVVVVVAVVVVVVVVVLCLLSLLVSTQQDPMTCFTLHAPAETGQFLHDLPCGLSRMLVSVLRLFFSAERQSAKTCPLARPASSLADRRARPLWLSHLVGSWNLECAAAPCSYCLMFCAVGLLFWISGK